MQKHADIFHDYSWFTDKDLRDAQAAGAFMSCSMGACVPMLIVWNL